MIALISACDQTAHYAPVTDINVTEPLPKHGVHEVKKGETLYGLAWAYGLDFRDVAALNQLDPNQPIRVGQRLMVKARIGKTKPTPQKSAENMQQPTLKEPPAPALKESPSTTISMYAFPKGRQWVWPTRGQVVSLYDGTHKGINISGQKGQSIHAAASGKVVYAGNGLRGYGNLIIIKHSNLYLSAYAHNSALEVHEGQRVRQGEIIARMGDTGADRPMLYFEIRKAGKPVNPMTLLQTN